MRKRIQTRALPCISSAAHGCKERGKGMATLPNLSALSLEPHDTSAVGGSVGQGGQPCNPKTKHKGKCVRIRLHPKVFEAVRGQIDIRKMNAFTTSLVILGPFSHSDPRYRQSTIANLLYNSPQWKTFKRWYLCNNEQRNVTRRFAYGTEINVNPGYYGAKGWTTMTFPQRGWTWSDLFEGGNVRMGLPKAETAPHYEPGLFYAELCMEPDWDLKKHPDHTVAFIQALFDYNVEHIPCWAQTHAEKREEERRAEERNLKRSLPASPTRETNLSKEQRGGAGSSAEPAPDQPVHVAEQAPGRPEEEKDSVARWLQQIEDISPGELVHGTPHPARNSPDGSRNIRDDWAFRDEWDKNQGGSVQIPDDLPPLGLIEELNSLSPEYDDPLDAELRKLLDGDSEN